MLAVHEGIVLCLLEILQGNVLVVTRHSCWPGERLGDLWLLDWGFVLDSIWSGLWLLLLNGVSLLVVLIAVRGVAGRGSGLCLRDFPRFLLVYLYVKMGYAIMNLPWCRLLRAGLIIVNDLPIITPLIRLLIGGTIGLLVQTWSLFLLLHFRLE